MILQAGKERHKMGFTLLELLVVLVIMSMIIAMSVPAFSTYQRGARLRSASREISSAIMLARTQAITLRKERAVVFVEADREFGIAGDEEGWTLPPGIRFNFTGTYEVLLTPTGRVEGVLPLRIKIFSDENGNGIWDTGEPQREITVGALGHVEIN
ncbi:MAG: hypothetical protein DDT32_01075 [Syntrophomonadaceae bacterium]|nr:hypothetical protein [Bacillota bacterium]